MCVNTVERNLLLLNFLIASICIKMLQMNMLDLSWELGFWTWVQWGSTTCLLKLAVCCFLSDDPGQLNLGLVVPSPSLFHKFKRTSSKEAFLSRPCFLYKEKGKFLTKCCLQLVRFWVICAVLGIGHICLYKVERGMGWGWSNSNPEINERTTLLSAGAYGLWVCQDWVPALPSSQAANLDGGLVILLTPTYDTGDLG
jgi:hypothetical protein